MYIYIHTYIEWGLSHVKVSEPSMAIIHISTWIDIPQEESGKQSWRDTGPMDFWWGTTLFSATWQIWWLSKPMTDPWCGIYMLTLIGGILMGSMAHHIYSSTMDPSWEMNIKMSAPVFCGWTIIWVMATQTWGHGVPTDLQRAGQFSIPLSGEKGH